MDVRRAIACRAPWLVAAVLVSWAVTGSETDTIIRAALEDEGGWYAPIEDDFRLEYERDRANHQVQTWNQYWGWIKSFYDGTTLSSGWSKLARETVEAVNSKARQKELIELFNDLGKRIAMEWAKDYGVRKISTVDLSRSSVLIVRAQQAEDGSGERLRAVLLKIRAEVKKRMERQPTREPGRGPSG
jgi:hypothetical protein